MKNTSMAIVPLVFRDYLGIQLLRVRKKRPRLEVMLWRGLYQRCYLLNLVDDVGSSIHCMDDSHADDVDGIDDDDIHTDHYLTTLSFVQQMKKVVVVVVDVDVDVVHEKKKKMVVAVLEAVEYSGIHQEFRVS